MESKNNLLNDINDKLYYKNCSNKKHVLDTISNISKLNDTKNNDLLDEGFMSDDKLKKLIY